MNINFDTANIIIVAYMGSSAGRFLINCLGTNNSAVLQDSVLAEQQLNNALSVTDKVQLLNSRLDTTFNVWTDLGFDCYSLFGIDTGYYQLKNFSVRDHSDMFNNVVARLSNSDKKFFIAALSMDDIRGIQQVWPNAKLVYLTNSNSFIDFRSNSLFKEMWNNWDTIRSVRWPVEAPATVAEYESLEPYIKTELENRFGLNVKRYHNNINLRHLEANEWTQRTAELPGCIEWDTNNYFSLDKTVTELAALYSKLELDGFDADLVQDYHQRWMTKLSSNRS
jgi:hypothetical protein